MAPILGIYASQMSGHLAVPNSYYSIATQTVGSGGASSITFSSIPSTYTHLQIRVMALSAASFHNTLVQFNGDTGANYTLHQLVGNGSAASAYGTGGQNNFTLGQLGTSTYPGVEIMDILDYANTNKYKTVRDLSGTDSNGTGQTLIILRSGVWMNTSAVTSITLTNDGGSYNQYSSFALYGVK